MSTPEDPVQDADRIAAAAKKAGKFLGMPIGNRAGFEIARSYGAGLVSVVEVLDGAMNAGLRQAFEIAAGDLGVRLDDLPKQQLAMGERRRVGSSAGAQGRGASQH